MRAKMRVISVEKFETCERLKFSAVSKSQYDQEGLDENNTFSKFTPQAELSMTIANPNLIGKFKPGEAYYVDFTPVNK